MNTELLGLKNDFNQIALRYDHSHEALWTYFNQQHIIPCANPTLVEELDQHQKELESKPDAMAHIKYSIAASLTPNVFNLGGQLSLIRYLASTQDRAGLLNYATKAVELLASRLGRFNNAPIINISLIQGLALGGGLEGALASDIVFAERQSIIGFPEVLFNMFPGMGGYSLVSRKAGNKVADEMMLKGKQYTAEQAYDMGLVDVLVEKGEGEQAIYNWIRQNKRFFNGQRAVYEARNRVNPITYEELMDITLIWVDIALKLGKREFSIMDRFIHSQEKQYLNAATDTNVVPIKQAS